MHESRQDYVQKKIWFILTFSPKAAYTKTKDGEIQFRGAASSSNVARRTQKNIDKECYSTKHSKVGSD